MYHIFERQINSISKRKEQGNFSAQHKHCRSEKRSGSLPVLFSVLGKCSDKFVSE